jgi:DGQHR domain-containing protein
MNINRKNIIPNNVIIAIGSELSPTLDEENLKLQFSYNNDEESNKNKALIIDGQHRVFGLNEYSEESEVIVTALLDIDLLDQAFQFVVINNKSQSAKPVDVKAVINADSFRLENFSDRLIEAGIRYGSTSTILDYFDRDTESPFKGLLDWDLNKKGTRIVQIKAIEDIVKNTQKEISYFKENDESEVINFISAIWTLIHEKYPNAWLKAIETKHKESTLLKKSTIIAITNFIIMYTKFTKKITKFSYNNLTKEFINENILQNCIDKIPEEFWTQQWHTGLDTSAGKALISSSLDKIVDNVDENIAWYKGVEVIKNFT